MLFRARATASGTAPAAIATAAEHAEIAGNDFKAGPFLAFLVLPFARLNPSFDKNQRAFFQVLLRDLRLFAPHNNFVPLRALLAISGFVFVGFIGSDTEIGQGTVKRTEHFLLRASLKLLSEGGKLGFEVRDLIPELRNLLGERFQAI